MLLRGLLYALPFAGVAIGAANSHPLLRLRAEGSGPVDETVTTKKFILELDAGSYDGAVNELASRPGTRILKRFSTDIFTGVSVESEELNLDSLQEIGPVKKAWPMRIIPLSEPTKLQSFSDDATAAHYSVHGATAVDKLHAAGIYGEGVVIAVVDTGIDHTHPALGGCFGEGCTIAGGHDFVGDVGDWPTLNDTKYPDADPMDFIGHGTHVAGIIVGKSDTWTGVAPKATLLGLKVFDNGIGTDEDTLIEAFLYAYEQDVDIITASVGGPDGWSTNAWAEVATRIVDSGVVVTIANGNFGTNGPFFASNGASGEHVIGVASVDADGFPAQPLGLTFSLDEQVNATIAGYIPSTFNFPAEVVDWPIVPIDLDVTNPASGCEPLPNNTQDLSTVIPLVRRGSCTFTTKQQNLQKFGAKYILIYNNESPNVTPFTDDEGSLIGIIDAAAGEAIIGTILAGGNVTAGFDPQELDIVSLDYAASGRPSTFTSWGGTYDLQIKPDIAAPGGNIFSTFLDGEWAVQSGTSMATPYVAGVAALYIGVHGGRKVHGKEFAKDLAMRIISSGNPVPWFNGADNTGFTAPVPQVGTGLIDAFKIVKYTTSLRYQKFALNDTLHFRDNQGVTITNTADTAISYSFNVKPAAGFEMLDTPDPAEYFSQRILKLVDLVPVEMVPDVKLPSGSFLLEPGQTKKAKFEFSLPSGVNSTMLPVYSGNIIITSSNGEILSVPYFGLAADLKAEMDTIFENSFPFSVSSNLLSPLQDKNTYTWNLGSFGTTGQDFPKMYVKLKYGTREVRWDIFESGYDESQWSYPPVPGKNGFIGSTACHQQAGVQPSFDPTMMDPNNTFAMPDYGKFRNAQVTNSYFEYWWLGKMADGSRIPVGNWTMRFAALKPFANPKHKDSWDLGAFGSVMPIEVLEPDVLFL